MSKLLELPFTTIDGEQTTFGAVVRGRSALVVNVASRCGLTPQYSALEALQRIYTDRGFTVVGFPCNQFYGQEPGSEADIATFCSSQYGVTFPMSRKVEVNGPDRDPIYAALTAAGGPADIRWNFEKFLVDGEGTVRARFEPRTEPDAVEVVDAIERTLAR
jgi:glutathione peroxidase